MTPCFIILHSHTEADIPGISANDFELQVSQSLQLSSSLTSIKWHILTGHLIALLQPSQSLPTPLCLATTGATSNHPPFITSETLSQPAGGEW